MSKFKLISIIIGIILIAGIAYAIWRSSGVREAKPPAGGLASDGFEEVGLPAGSPTSTDALSGDATFQSPTSENPLTPQTSSSGDYAKLLREQGKIYEEFDVMFRFLYPPDFTVTEIDDELGYTILAQNSAKKAAFQIFLNPFDEPGPITPARIKKDLPNMVIENPKPVLIGADKNIPALIFFSQEPSLGRTREIWFVGNGHLFQVETFADQDSMIGPVMDTFQFLQ